MSARWRGTVVYIGSLVVIGAAAFAKYGGVLGQDTQGATTAFASASSSATASPEPSPDRSQRARPQATDKSGSTDETAAESADKATAEAEPPETEAPAPPPEEDPPAPEQVTITGAEASSIRGPVQVAVTFEGDRIVDVITIQAGTDARESIRINDEALPILRQEALAAQSAQIDTVSGATYTSDGYRTSLQSAIDQNG
ncbi:FMN-binding protein [Promicromonospora soli]